MKVAFLSGYHTDKARVPAWSSPSTPLTVGLCSLPLFRLGAPTPSSTLPIITIHLSCFSPRHPSKEPSLASSLGRPHGASLSVVRPRLSCVNGVCSLSLLENKSQGPIISQAWGTVPGAQHTLNKLRGKNGFLSWLDVCPSTLPGPRPVSDHSHLLHNGWALR